WNEMFTRATALEGPDAEKTRGDFSAAELRSGGDMYFLATDNRSREPSISRLRVSEGENEQLVIELTNVTPLRWLFVTFAAPGDLQSWYFLDHEAGDIWRYYSFTRMHYSSRLFSAIVPDASYVNCAVAKYSFV